MSRQHPIIALVFALSALCSGLSRVEAAPVPRATEALGKLPLAFERNQGQATPAAQFLARGAGYTVTLSRGTARIALRRDKDAAPAAIDLRLVGARRNPRAAGRNPLLGKVNYFLGNDPSRWRTDIPTFGRVEYADVYRGIDLAYYGNHGCLEYDFIVAPGADPAAIRIETGGARKIQVDGGGNLVLDTSRGEVRFLRPVTYQEIAGTRHPVESHYLLAGSKQIRFSVGAYDVRYAVVIDPSLAYSTYLGGSTFDSATAIAVSPGGNAFVTGQTSSMDFPLVNAEQSTYGGEGAIFVSKLTGDGSGLVYSTYFGGLYNDTVHAIAVDTGGNAYIVGSTMSPDSPLKNPLYSTLNGASDAFITKFSPEGNALVYSTYLGGSSGDEAYGVAVDAGQNAYIAGTTYSTDFPVTPGAYQTSCSSPCSFVTKINGAESALTWSTYFGQTSGQSYGAMVEAMVVDSHSGVYLTGWTTGALPVTPGAPQPAYGGNQDAFVAKLSDTGASLAYCTYLGGSQLDTAYAIAVDSAGNAYVAGGTESTDLAVTALALQTTLAGYENAFVAKLDSAGTQWEYLTYLGGQRYDAAYGIAVNASGDAIVTGYTWSSNFPRVSAIQLILPGNQTDLYKTTSGGATWSASDSGIEDESITAIVVDPALDAHVLALASWAGLFQSTDGGANWSANANLGFTPVSFLTLSPSGEAYAAQNGEILYVSYDSGTTWNLVDILPCSAQTALIDPTSFNLYIGGGGDGLSCAQEFVGATTWAQLAIQEQNGVYGFAITPGSPGILYAATGNGLFQSSDAERGTWTAAGLQGQTVSAVVIDPSQPATLYALASGAVFKSTDAGGSWASSSAGLPASVTSLAIAASSGSVLYAGTPSGVFRSKNSAASWSHVGPGRNQITALAVDPTSAGEVYAAAPVYYDAFVAKINPAGSELVYSTFLGGTYSDSAYGIALDSGGDVFVAGATQSPDFPTTSGAFQPATGLPRYSAFVTKIAQPTPACSYSASPSALFLYAGGGLANFSVVSPARCAWTPVPSAPWITVASGAGPGVAPLAISVAANTGVARTATIAIGNTSIAITQAAGGCTYLLSANSLTFPQTGGPQSLNVTAGAGCQWVVTGLPLWLTIASGASGTGDGTVTLQAAPNLFSMVRPSISPLTINVANNSVTVSQSGTSAALSH